MDLIADINFCDSNFESQYERQKKMNTLIEGVHEGKKHECSECNKKFSQIEKLRSHMKFHTGEGLKMCKFCDFKSDSNQNMNKHLEKHTTDKGNFCQEIVLPQ